jgi:hypothetical protein
MQRSAGTAAREKIFHDPLELEFFRSQVDFRSAPGGTGPSLWTSLIS